MKHSAKIHSATLARAGTSPSGIGRSSAIFLGSGGGRAHPQIQSGVLAWRRDETDGVQVLLVRKLRSKDWGIPKGKLTGGLSSAENAAKEAFEEAGVKGRVEERAAATYRAMKRKLGEKIVIEVSVHMLEVTGTLDDWPEKDIREFRWCSPQEAAKLLHEPVLIELCRGLRSRAI